MNQSLRAVFGRFLGHFGSTWCKNKRGREKHVTGRFELWNILSCGAADAEVPIRSVQSWSSSGPVDLSYRYYRDVSSLRRYWRGRKTESLVCKRRHFPQTHAARNADGAQEVIFSHHADVFASFLIDPAKKPARVFTECPRLLFTKRKNAGSRPKNVEGKKTLFILSLRPGRAEPDNARVCGVRDLPYVTLFMWYYK